MDTTSKVASRMTALSVFRTVPYISSTEVCETTGMSRSTTHRAVEHLRRKNLLVVAGKGQSTDSGGKKPVLLCLNRTYRHILCFHIKVTGLSAGVADLSGRLLAKSSVAFPANSPLNLVLSHMNQCHRELASGLRLVDMDFAGVGVGCDGIADPDSGILTSSPNFSSWGNNIPLKTQVEAMFKAPPPVFVDNSNRFGAYAEYRIGRAQGVDSFMILDGHRDGIGAAVVIDGELWRGSHRLAGELGHITVEAKGGRECPCGAKGCLGTVTRMSYLEEVAREAYSKRKTRPAEFQAIYDAANNGDPAARKAVGIQAQWLAVGINAAALLLDPKVIIFQGDFVHGGDYLIEAVVEKAAALGLPRMADKATIRHSRLTDARCLEGQAQYIADKFFNQPELYD